MKGQERILTERMENEMFNVFFQDFSHSESCRTPIKVAFGRITQIRVCLHSKVLGRYPGGPAPP
jgi:hypothetical protein